MIYHSGYHLYTVSKYMKIGYFFDVVKQLER